MYYLLSLFSGILISLMVALNGGLTEKYGAYSATVFIHLTGLFLISALLVIHRDRPFLRRCTWPLYLGGAIGVATTVFTNMAFGRISVSAILALGLICPKRHGINRRPLWHHGDAAISFSQRQSFRTLSDIVRYCGNDRQARSIGSCPVIFSRCQSGHLPLVKCETCRGNVHPHQHILQLSDRISGFNSRLSASGTQ